MISSQVSSFISAVHRFTGIVLDPKEAHLIEKRMKEFFRVFDVDHFDDSLLITEESIEKFVNIVTNNESAFFRDNYPFKYLEQSDFSRYEKLRVLSLPSSRGQEAISILHMLEVNKSCSDYDIHLCDIDTHALHYFKKEGFFKFEIERGFKEIDLISNYFKLIGNRYFLKEEWSSKLFTMKVNILTDALEDKEYDIIFFRNLLFYFNQDDKSKALNNIINTLSPSGVIFVGNGERLSHNRLKMEKIDNFNYYKLVS